MLTRLGTNRAVSRCQQAPLMKAVRVQQVRPLVSCSYSKRDEVWSNWDSLRNNPSEWYDNRHRKQNPRAPDFVRKDDRNVAIWLDGRENPDWSEQVLAELDEQRQERAESPERSGGGRSDRAADDLAKWEALRSNPEEWYDNRRRKQNPRAPDFVRRDDRSAAIWVDSSSTPGWAGEVLAMLDARFEERRGDRPDRAADDLAKWESLRSNPDLWYDNRRRKTNPRAPDFVLREDRAMALWLDSATTPEWLGQLLAELDDRAAQMRAASSSQAQESYRQERYQQADAYQEYEQPRGASPGRGAGSGRREEELAKWESLRDHPEEWYDNRDSKTSPRAPDFKRKDDRNVALWLESNNRPEFLEELLVGLDARKAQRTGGYQNAQQYPGGYSQQQGGQQREQRQRGPPVGADLEARKAAELSNWESLRDHPEEWYDNRNNKTNPRAPDFKRKDDRSVALWVSSYGAPEWLGQLLEELNAQPAAY